MSDEVDKANIEAQRLLDNALLNNVLRRIAGPPIYEKIIDGKTVRLCADCEETIPPKRIEAHPTAALCVECQESYEKKEALYD